MAIKDVKKWSTEKLVYRVREIRRRLHTEQSSSKRFRLQDEMVAILLESLLRTSDDWGKDSTPMDIFPFIYPAKDIGHELYSRFVETRCLVWKFKESDDEGRVRLKPKLIARGMI